MYTEKLRTQAVEELVNSAIKLNDLYLSDHPLPKPYFEALFKEDGSSYKVMETMARTRDNMGLMEDAVKESEENFFRARDNILDNIPFKALLETNVQARLTNYLLPIATVAPYQVDGEHIVPTKEKIEVLPGAKFDLLQYSKLLAFLEELIRIEQVGDVHPWLEIELFEGKRFFTQPEF